METSPSLPALLDSGATHPVISSNIVQNLLLPTYCCADQPWFDIRTFREDEVETIVHRLTSLKFTFNGKAYVKEFVVYPSAADRFFIGWDFIKEHPSIFTELSHNSKTLVTPDLLATTLKDYVDTPLSLPPTRPNDYKFRFTQPFETLSPGHTMKYSFSGTTFLVEEGKGEAPPRAMDGLELICNWRLLMWATSSVF